MNLKQMTERIRTFCQQRDWDQFHGAKDLAIGLVTESSEFLEIFRFQSEEQIRTMLQNSSDRERMADELADSLFFILRFADRFQFDLPSALERKLEKSAEKYPVEKSFGKNQKYDQL